MSGNKHIVKLDQKGAASLLFSMIMLTVISLVVLSFAQLARRGQQQVLDSQLSNQAYYAAESGVNDTIQAIAQLQIKAPDKVSSSGCKLNDDYAGTHKIQPNLNSDGSVGYTCVTVNATPSDLVVQKVGSDESSILNVSPTALAGSISQLTIRWTPSDEGRTVSPAELIKNCPTPTPGSAFKTKADWKCPLGVLRFDLVPTPTSGKVTRASLLANTLTVFAVPTTSPLSNVVYSSAVTQQGQQSNASCTTTLAQKASCSITITNLTGSDQYALRMMTKYDDAAKVQVTGVNAAYNAVPFQNGQAVIDVTGKAQNVLRRLQVRVPLKGTGSGFMDQAISSQDSICKRFIVYETQAADQDPGCPSIPN